MGKIGIIIQREFNQRVRKKSFIITTILTPLLFIGVIAVMGLVMASDFSGPKKLLVSDASGLIADKLESDRRMEFEPTTMSLERIKELRREGSDEVKDIYGVLVIGDDVVDNPRGVQMYTYEPSTIDVELKVAGAIEKIIEAEKLKRYDIEGLPQIMEEVKTDVAVKAYRIEDSGEEKESVSVVAMVASYIFGFLIYMFIFMYGAMVMQGVIEEKNSKVIEVIVSSVKPFQLMMGKIFGIVLVAFTQLAIWAVFFVAASAVIAPMIAPDMTALQDMTQMPGMDAGAMMSAIDAEAMDAIRAALDPVFLTKLFVGFVIYFIGGYLLYSAMFAAVGSAVSNEADSQQLQLPITIPLMLAIIVMFNVMRDPNSTMAVWFSIIPFTSPIVMMARLPYGVPTWELVTSVVVLIATFLLLVWLAGKIYRVGIFMHGKKPSFAELGKWLRYKY